jgi:hypothetical protein
VNRTPGAASNPAHPQETVEVLSAGIRDFVGEAAPRTP